jgi:all-trans-retinol 13,14-reductase
MEFKERTVPYMNYNFYGYNSDSPWGCEKYDEESWPKGYLYMHFCHDDSKFAKTGVILSYMQMKDVDLWTGTSVGNRGEAYEKFKKYKAEQLLNSLEKQFPNIRSCIKHYYTSTPLTYLDYTGTEGGSMYGVAKDVHLGAACRVPHKLRIPNVYQTGQNINSHGMLGVLVGTIVTCSEFLSAKTIFEQIVETKQ